MDAPAPAIAHLDIPSGTLYWVDAGAIAKEFVVFKQEGNRKIRGSLTTDRGLSGLQTGKVSKTPESYLSIQWLKEDGSQGTTFISTQTIAEQVVTTSQAGQWVNT